MGSYAGGGDAVPSSLGANVVVAAALFVKYVSKCI
jgi:hypothetical protein